MKQKLLRSLWVPQPMKNLVEFFFLFILFTWTKSMWSSRSIRRCMWLKNHAILLVESLSDCNWTAKISQIWDLYSKIENNLQFWGHFLVYFAAFAQRELFIKNLVEYNWSGPATFKCQRQRVDYMSTETLFHCYQRAKIIQSICSIHQIICEIHLI